MIHHIKPMLTTLVKEPFDRKGWLFEIKWDGFRAIAEIKKGRVELYSRNLLSFNEQFAPIVKSLSKIKKNMVLDGEVVVVDKDGRSRFQLLQNYNETGEGNLKFFVFDILFFNGKDLRSMSLAERKQILEKNLPKLSNIKFSSHVEEKGLAFFNAARKMGLEGIVAKDSSSAYHAGKRTWDWLKIKLHQQQEAVIGGFTQPRGSRKKLGALVLGVYEKGKFIYIGHTGGGFNDKSLNLVYNKLTGLVQKKSPFEKTPKTNAPVTWIKPKLVCEVTFAEWTDSGHMRQPIFLGLRPDKKPTEVKKELPKT
jgi:bifunctional non-homologous end joining protein LigD